MLPLQSGSNFRLKEVGKRNNNPELEFLAGEFSLILDVMTTVEESGAMS